MDQCGFEPHSRVHPVSSRVFLAINPYSTSQSQPAAKRVGALTAVLLAPTTIEDSPSLTV